MAYNKTDAANELGISKKELENRAKSAGYDNTEQYYWSLGKTAAGSSGEYGNTTGIGSTGSMNAVLGKIGDEQSAFIDKWKSDIPAIYAGISEQQGLGGLMSQAQTQTQNLEDIPGQEQTAAKQFGMSTSRMAKRISGRQAEQAPIAQRAISQAQFAQQTVNQLFQNAMQPYSTEAQLMASRHAMEMTGYNNQVANNLSLQLQEMVNKGAVDAAQMQNIADMALLEKKFELTLQNDLALYDHKNVGAGGDIERDADIVAGGMTSGNPYGVTGGGAYFTPLYADDVSGYR